MRRTFADELYQWMKKDDRIWLITGDLGQKVWDQVRDDFPARFLNTGAAEQAMMGIACGLALEGKKPFVYSITTFLLYRPFETIRNYISHEQIPVRLVGSGRDKDYEHDGFSHHAEEAEQVLKLFPNIKTHWPEYKEEIPLIVQRMVKRDGPSFVSLRR